MLDDYEYFTYTKDFLENIQKKAFLLKDQHVL